MLYMWYAVLYRMVAELYYNSSLKYSDCELLLILIE